MSIFKGIKINSTIAREFAFFLLLTSIVAGLIKLSKPYTTTCEMVVNLTDLPIDKTVRSISPSTVEVNVTSSGFALLRNKMKSLEFNIPFKTLTRSSDGIFVYDVNNHQELVKESLKGDVEILNVQPGQLSLNIDSMSSKMVPVEAHVMITYASGYGQKGGMTIEPDSVLIVGSSTLLDKIDVVNTDALSLKEVSSTVQEVISIKNTDSTGVLTYNAQEVVVKQEVTKYTEGSVTVPVEIQNESNSVIKILPKTVEIVYTVELEEFDSISPSDFLVTCSYDSSSDVNSYLPLTITTKPDKVTSARLVNKQVKFIVVN